MTPSQRGFAATAANVSLGEKSTPIMRDTRPGAGLFCTLSETEAMSVTKHPSNDFGWAARPAARRRRAKQTQPLAGRSHLLLVRGAASLALRGQHKLLI